MISHANHLSGRIKMAETEKSLSKEQIFRQVKQLCMKADFAPSRQLICQAAGLTPPDPMKISRAFIRSQTQNKIVHQMLDIEQAFARLRKTFSGDEPDENEAQLTAQNLENILPLMSNNQERLFVRYWIDNCYGYLTDITPEKRLENINEIINLIPKGKNDSLLYSYSLLVKDLNISAADKYHTVKKAYQKTNKQEHLSRHYKELLNKTGKNYYYVLCNTASDANTPYNQRCSAVYDAVDVLKDIKYSMSYKCRARIELLNALEKLQQRQNDAKGMQKTFLLRRKYINHLNNINRLFPNPADEYYYR
uniref:hypothetical protein n=1 Tax=Candidatus Scatocola faecipullorum TaxID=2840917 RepID=UPI004024E691